MDTVELRPEVIEGIKAFAADVARRIAEADGGTDRRAGRLLFQAFGVRIGPERVDDGAPAGRGEIEGNDLLVAFALSVSPARAAHPEAFEDWTDVDAVRVVERVSVVLRQVEQVARREGLELDRHTAFTLSAWAVLIGAARVS